ncbi:hypothetical protein QE152_g24260 [Popillia japonica]|uniref:Uncharacterized protein n=1 Tax=Popillia japonica TaxID=7064 RepID=A0AAW1KH83_POPJA
MLSYMLSVDEKPPPGPGKGHLQLVLAPEPLTNGTSSISKETSVSSFVSDVTTTTASHSSMTPSSTSDKVKPKLLINGAKHQTLKR